MKRVVLDTTALIFLADFSAFEEVCTVQDVVDEVKDRMTSMKLAALLKELKVIEPSRMSVDEVKEIAEQTGDLPRLSETDIKVLALARQTGGILISDDYGIQNVAGHAGIKFVSVHNPEIKKLRKWQPEPE